MVMTEVCVVLFLCIQTSLCFDSQFAFLLAAQRESDEQSELVPDENTRTVEDELFSSGEVSSVGGDDDHAVDLDNDESLLQNSIESIDESLLQTISASHLQEHGCFSLEGDNLELENETSVEDTLMTEEYEHIFQDGDAFPEVDEDLREADADLEVDDLGLEIPFFSNDSNDAHSLLYDADDLFEELFDDTGDIETELFDELLEESGVVAFIQQKRLSASSEDEREYAVEAKRAKLVI